MKKLDINNMTPEQYDAYQEQKRQENMARVASRWNTVVPESKKYAPIRTKTVVEAKPVSTINPTETKMGLRVYDSKSFSKKSDIKKIRLQNLEDGYETEFLKAGKKQAPASKAPASKTPASKAPASKTPASKAPASKKPSLAGKSAGESSRDPYSKGDLTPEQKTSRAKSAATDAKAKTISKTNEKTTQKVEVEKKHVKIKQVSKANKPLTTAIPKPASKPVLTKDQIQQRVVGAFKPKPVLNKTPATPKQLERRLEIQIYNDRVAKIINNLNDKQKELIAKGGKEGNEIRVAFKKDAWRRAKERAPKLAKKIDSVEPDDKKYSRSIRRIAGDYQQTLQAKAAASAEKTLERERRKQARRSADPDYKAAERKRQQEYRDKYDKPIREKRSDTFAKLAAEIDKKIKQSKGKLGVRKAIEGITVEVYDPKTGKTKTVPFTHRMYKHGKAVTKNPKLRGAVQKVIRKVIGKTPRFIQGKFKTSGKHFSEHKPLDLRKGAKRSAIWKSAKMGYFKQGLYKRMANSEFVSKFGRKRRSFAIFKTEKTMNIPGKEHMPAEQRAGIAIGIKTGMSMNALLKVDSRAVRAAMTGPFQTRVKKAIQNGADNAGRKLISLVEPYVPKDQGYMYTSAKVDPHAVQSMMGTAQDLIDPSTEMFGVTISYNTPYAHEVYFGSHRHGAEFNEYYGTAEKGEKETARWIEIAFSKEQAGLRAILDDYAKIINAELNSVSTNKG